MDERSHARLALRALVVCAVIGGVAWLVRQIDLPALRDALAAATLWPIVVAAAINFGIIGCKAVAWRILLVEHRVPLGRLFRYTLISCASSVVFPLRAGELLRLWLLRDRDGVPIAYAATIAGAEKVLDALSMLVLVAPAPLFVRSIPASVTWWIAGIAIATIATLLAALAFAPRLGTSGWRGEIARALSVLRAPKRFAASFAVLLVSWWIDLAMIELVLFATGIPPSVGTGLLVLLSVNVAIAVPSTPGQLGTLELGAVLGLRLAGVNGAASVAFALLYHALQVIPITLGGLFAGAPAVWKRRS